MNNRALTRIAAGLASAALAISLAACAGGAPSPGASTSTPASSAPATPTPSPETPTSTPAEPTPVADDLSTWIVSPTAMGPIALGDDFAATTQRLQDWTNDDNCRWTSFWNTPDKTLSVYFARDGEIDDGPVRTVSVDALDAVSPGDAPHTESGVGIGSTRDEVLAAYPDAVEQSTTIDPTPMLRVGEQGTAAMFFIFRDGETVSSITVTAAPEPPYEVCG